MSATPTTPASIAPPHVRALHAYVPGRQPTESDWVKLNTNENPYPPSPHVSEAIKRAADESLRLYPDPRSTTLRRAFARRHGLQEENVLIGNGSDDVLNLLIRAFASGSAGAAFAVPSYSLYPVLIAIENSTAHTIELDRSMQLPIEQIAASTANILFLTSPNAPTSVGFRTDEIAELATSFQGLLIVDEAYAEFAEESAIPLLAGYPRLVVTRTLSKSHALAGIRVGCALAHPETIDLLDRVRDSYNINRLSQAGAVAALADEDYYAGLIAKIKITREASRSRCDALGWFTYPSQTNFIFTEPRTRDGRTGADVAQSCFEHLEARRVLVRYFGGHALTRSFLRITVGTDAQMAVLFEAIESWLKNA